MGAHFSEAAVTFLRDLTKHNDREWFGARKHLYEAELKDPMLAVIGEVNQVMLGFAPEHVRAPEKSMMRIYRDIRFSKDKRPYKLRVAAWWARQGMEKTSGGGFYFDLSATEITIAAGAYMPEREQMLGIRRHLMEHHERFRLLSSARTLRGRMVPMEHDASSKLTRPPKGFPRDHPAIDLLMQKEWGVAARLPVEVAFGTGLVKEIASRFRLAAPIVALLNEPLAARVRKPLF